MKKLGRIFEKNAVELKMNAPRQRVDAMIDEIIAGGYMGAQPIAGIRQYQEQLRRLKEKREKHRGGNREGIPPCCGYQVISKSAWHPCCSGFKAIQASRNRKQG